MAIDDVAEGDDVDDRRSSRSSGRASPSLGGSLLPSPPSLPPMNLERRSSIEDIVFNAEDGSGIPILAFPETPDLTKDGEVCLRAVVFVCNACEHVHL